MEEKEKERHRNSEIRHEFIVEGHSYSVKFVSADSDNNTVSDKMKYLIDGKKAS